MFSQLTTGENSSFVVGINWVKPYWLAAEIWGSEISLRKLSHISEINNYYLTADAVLIDIPVGLPESATEHTARHDRKARDRLPTGRKSTIFPVPCRQAVYMKNYAEASKENESILGKKLTSQSHAFSKMIRQVDEFLSENSHCQNSLAESHPEVAFQILNGGKGVQYSKHTEEGITERMAILHSHGIDREPHFADFAPKQYEDVLDALCLALSAKLGWENGFCTIPENPACDSRGRKMQMIFGVSEKH